MKIRGIDFALHENEDLSNHIRREQDFFEPDILDYLAKHHKTQKVILDIGANIGNHAVYFANFLNYKSIWCFEPIPENVDLLLINTAPYHDINVLMTAVSASTTGPSLQMIKDRNNMGASRIDDSGTLTVNSVSIDRLALNDVTLMKIDVEEHEPSVIEGAKDTIYRCHPLILIEDWHKQYHTLLPDYELEKAWPDHQTYLYKWKK